MIVWNHTIKQNWQGQCFWGNRDLCKFWRGRLPNTNQSHLASQPNTLSDMARKLPHFPSCDTLAAGWCFRSTKICATEPANHAFRLGSENFFVSAARLVPLAHSPTHQSLSHLNIRGSPHWLPAILDQAGSRIQFGSADQFCEIRIHGSSLQSPYTENRQKTRLFFAKTEKFVDHVDSTTKNLMKPISRLSEACKFLPSFLFWLLSPLFLSLQSIPLPSKIPISFLSLCSLFFLQIVPSLSNFFSSSSIS